MKKSTIDKLKKGYSSSRSIPVKTTQTSRAKPHQYYDQDSVATTKARLRREEEAFQKARTKTEERKAAEQARDEQFNADVDQIDFMTMDEDASQKAEQKYKQLCAAVVMAKEAEKDAIQKLWSAKYDTMTTKQLQAALAEAEDKDEKAYIQKVQSNRVAEQRKKDLKTMNSIGDPESVLYDPDFLEKSDYRSTKLPEGEWGESDTGYADIDYEFINNNPEISELIVGKERNYYQITEQERRVYNYWHHYDREHGTNVAENYLNLLQETLNDRDSALDFAKIEGKPFLEWAYGGQAGLSRWANNVNIGYLRSDGYIPMTSMEMTSRRIYNDMADDGDFLKINGKSLGQLGYEWIEDAGYNLPGNIAKGLIGQGSFLAGAVAKGLVLGAAENGGEYRELVNKDYTKDQAEKYADAVIWGEVAKESASALAGKGLGALWDLLPSDSVMDTLGTILNKADWLGATKELESAIDEAVEKYALKPTAQQKNVDTGKVTTTAKGVVTTKALDKILNQLHSGMSEVSPDLRQALLESLKDPDVRQIVEQNGSFAPAQLGKRMPERLETEIKKKYLWDGTMVGRLLKDEAYTGTLICHKSERNKINKTFRFTEATEQFRHENYLPPIITRETWEQVQELNEGSIINVGARLIA